MDRLRMSRKFWVEVAVEEVLRKGLKGPTPRENGDTKYIGHEEKETEVSVVRQIPTVRDSDSGVV